MQWGHCEHFGSVIYRGLAAVNIGGVVVSLAFSLVLIPALMRLLAARRAAPAPLPVPGTLVSP